jgi:hypothetical protein
MHDDAPILASSEQEVVVKRESHSLDWLGMGLNFSHFLKRGPENVHRARLAFV